jgi:hypothetical protein
LNLAQIRANKRSPALTEITYENGFLPTPAKPRKTTFHYP